MCEWVGGWKGGCMDKIIAIKLCEMLCSVCVCVPPCVYVGVWCDFGCKFCAGIWCRGLFKFIVFHTQNTTYHTILWPGFCPCILLSSHPPIHTHPAHHPPTTTTTTATITTTTAITTATTTTITYTDTSTTTTSTSLPAKISATITILVAITSLATIAILAANPIQG